MVTHDKHPFYDINLNLHESEDLSGKNDHQVPQHTYIYYTFYIQYIQYKQYTQYIHYYTVYIILYDSYTPFLPFTFKFVTKRQKVKKALSTFFGFSKKFSVNF